MFEFLRIRDVSEQLSATQRQLNRLEEKVDLILEHLEIEYGPDALPEVIALLDKGKWMAAVKAYRRATGAGREEAEAAVEFLDARRELEAGT